MSIGTRIDGTAHLGNPQLHRVVDKHGECETELVAIERPLRLPNHHGIEVTTRVLERLEKLRRFRSA
jgi:hypothetical protein